MPLPVIFIEGVNGAKVWEESVLQCYRRGAVVNTEYGQRSRDSTMLMVIEDPLSEPRIHLSGLTIGRIDDLDMYVKEITNGIHDEFVREGKWAYSYHDRLFSYPKPDGGSVDQIELMIRKLAEVPYTRRAQAITWEPWYDPSIDDPPCLQRVICRVYGDELVMETSWRSRDAYKAAHMNIYAMTELQRVMAERISRLSGMRLKVGKYVDFSNFYHIYERDWEDVEERLIKSVEERPFATVIDEETGRMVTRGRAISSAQYRRMFKRSRGRSFS